MTAFNIVRMKLKPQHEEAYLKEHAARRDEGLYPGMIRMNVVKTGAHEYVVVGEWESMDALAAARPAMITFLDGFRDKLEDLGGGLGVTDPRSGEAVISAG